MVGLWNFPDTALELEMQTANLQRLLAPGRICGIVLDSRESSGKVKKVFYEEVECALFQVACYKKQELMGGTCRTRYSDERRMQNFTPKQIIWKIWDNIKNCFLKSWV